MKSKVFFRDGAATASQLLMERASNHYEGAIELIDNSVRPGTASFDVQKGPLAGLLYTPSMPTICACAPPPWKLPSRIHLQQIPETVENLLVRLQDEPEHRAWLLWILGVLGNRGVGTARLKPYFSIASTIPMKPLVPMPS